MTAENAHTFISFNEHLCNVDCCEN